MTTQTIRIEPFNPADSERAVGMLARAFVNNPIHVAAFGKDRLDLNEAMFRTGLPLMKGEKWAAVDDTGMLGFIHWIPYPGCRMGTLDKVRLVPAMLRAFGPRVTLRVGKWLSIWEKQDPDEPHVHLGPIAVEPSAQGKGIGQQLMRRYCTELDETRQAGYLETDAPHRVDFYRRFGFEVIAEYPVLGAPNYFMWRAVRSL